MRVRDWGAFVVGLGAIVLVTAAVHLYSQPLASASTGHLALDVILLGGAGLSLLYGGYRHLVNPLPGDRYPRVFGWILAGTLLFTSVNVISLYVGSAQVTRPELFEVVHLASSVGAVAGLLVGTVEGRALVHSRAAARAEARAQALERERERVDRVNEYLRHYVLNSLTVISGYASHLAGEPATDDAPELDVVEERVETIATLVDHVRTLSTTLQDDTPGVAYDLDALLATTLDDIGPPQTYDIETAGDPSVTAVPSLERALRLLFAALTEVIDADESLAIAVRERDAGASVSVSVSTGRPAAVTRDSFADAGPETGMKFSLAEEFVAATGTLHLGDSPEDTLACELVLDSDPGDRAHP